jgi:hypothetical protein
MRKDQFNEKHSSMNISQHEIDRKWRVFREQEEMQKLYEASVMIADGAAQAGTGGGGRLRWSVVTNTAYLYPAVNLEAALASTSLSIVQEGNRYIFATLEDLDQFYNEVWTQTAISQPVGNQGYSMGVGTQLASTGQEVRLELSNGTLVTLWLMMTQLTPQSANAPQWVGDSPQGTMGYGAVYADTDADGIPGTIDEVVTGNIDPLRFVRL